MEEKIKEIILKALKETAFTACVVGIVDQNGQRIVLPFGEGVKENSIFDVASVTKAIPTSSLALQLIDQGKLSPNDQLIRFVPEFANSDREKVLIKHLLTYTISFTFRLSDYKNNSPEEILEAIFKGEFEVRPGTKFVYINAAAILLGLVIERILKNKLDVLADDHFFIPLQMTRTTFHPEKFSKEEIIPTEFDSWRGRLIHGEVHDESTYTLNKKMVVGSSGLFSTTPDLLTFLEMLLKGGEFKGRKYFSERIIREMETNQIKHLHDSMGLGWELNQPRYMGHFCTPQTFGKTGYTGCLVLIDRQKGKALTMLTNYTFPHRKPDKALINRIRSEIADIVFK